MHYRQRADCDSYSVLAEKTGMAPWRLPAGFSIDPDPRSRFYDDSPSVDPLLPPPRTELYAYSLPELPTRDPRRFHGTAPARPGPAETAAPAGPSSVTLASYAEPLTETPNSTGPGAASAGDGGPAPMGRVPEEGTTSADVEQMQIVPLPKGIWESLPIECRRRMFEFTSLREEYQRTFGQEPAGSERDRAPKLALEDIVDLAQINSREYQRQKELLYLAALALTLSRYDYDLKFAVGRNNTAVDYTHSRDAGETVNSLAVPTNATVDKVLASGGRLLAQFANNVVLTFNGPKGFAADISSDLLLSVSQSLLQRDTVFENLTQAEREVVYAARRFARYRKALFNDLAHAYYNLLLAYRGIEISGLDYFGNVRGFYRAAEGYRATGQPPRFQVDQFEQSSLSSRSSLIGVCNALELSLDNLKLQVGLPAELPVNLDLSELQQLTVRDEAPAAAERVRRNYRNLLTEQQQTRTELNRLLKLDPARTPVMPPEVWKLELRLLNPGLDLAGKMLQLMDLREQLDHRQPERPALQQLRDRLAVEQADLEVRLRLATLAEERDPKPPIPPAPPLRIFERTLNVIEAVSILGQRRLDAAGHAAEPPARLADGWRRHGELRRGYEQIRSALEQVTKTRALERIPELVKAAEQLLADAERWAAALRRPDEPPPRVADEAQAALQRLQRCTAETDRLLNEADRLLAAPVGGLTPVEIDMDDAMLTAITLRLDLMNQRGALADDWRAIKLAGDDLKSILNLSASQKVGTRSDVNRPFDFTFDQSETELKLAVDAPFNRRAQRNKFRNSLIDYNQSLRALIALEDTIKRTVRNDLRALAQNQEQYRIAVSSAALASERLDSTRLQLRLGLKGVTARDVLESQQAYTTSLNNMAKAHIAYLLGRIDLFQELELLEVDEAGFWKDVYDEQRQPTPNWNLPAYAQPVYGELPRGVWYSHKMRRMLEVPVGQTTVYATDQRAAGAGDNATESGARAADAPRPPPE